MKKNMKHEEEVAVEQDEEAMMESNDDSLAFDSTQQQTACSGSASRQWQKDSTFQSQLVPGYSICVGITTRDESLPVFDTPSKMYSSLRYKLHYKCTVNAEQVSPFPKLLMCRITVIDDESGKEIKKDNKPIVDDSLISLKNTSSGNLGVYEANHKIKFKSVSFHHNKSKWRLSLQLFSDSNHSINTPVFVMKSGPFQVYARRPKVSERDATNGLLISANETSTANTTANTTSSAPSSSTNSTLKEDKKKKKSSTQEVKKRKRASSVKQEEEEQEENNTETCTTDITISHIDEEASQKKVKLMENFKKTLDLLLKYHSEMDDEDKVSGFGLIQQKMYFHFYGSIPTNENEHMIDSMIPIISNDQCVMEPTENAEEATTLQCGSADDLFNSSTLFSESTTNSIDIPVISGNGNEVNNCCSSAFEIDYFTPSMSEDFTAFI